MATRKAKPHQKPGLLFDVARVLSVGRERTTGQAVLRFRDERGRIVALAVGRRRCSTR